MRAVLCLLVLGASGLSTTPVRNVIKQLENILQTTTEDQRAETQMYEKYAQWCTDMSARKQRLIDEAVSRIADDEAQIAEAEATIKESIAEIERTTLVIAYMEGDKSAATAVRGIERAQYEAKHRDISESLTALRGAIKVLKAQDYDRAQAKSLLQTAVSGAPDTLKQAVAALVQTFGKASADAEDNDLDEEYQKEMAVRAPDAHAYEFRSQKIVDLLEKLFDEFDEEREKTERAEKALVQAYDMLMEFSERKHERAAARLKQARENLGEAKESKGAAEADKAEAITVRDSETSFKKDAEATCSVKESEYKDRMTLRQEEQVAITKAIDILKSNFVASTEMHLLQMSNDPQMDMDDAAAYLEKAAGKLRSPTLSTLAVRISTGGPFDKVKKMIEEMIIRLQEQANQETEQKAWCDKELATNKNERSDFSDKVEGFSAEIDELTGTIAQLQEQIAGHNDNIQNMRSDLKEAQETRLKEKDQNDKEIREAQEGQAMVQQALNILQDFYDKAGKATSLLAVKQSPDTPPEIWNAPYQGQQGLKGGVLGMMEVIMSDFARGEEETKQLEKKQDAEFTQFQADTTKSLQDEEMDKNFAESKLATAEERLPKAKVDLRENQKLLTKAQRYFDKLKPPCVKPDVSYEKRVEARAAEIESLQEALAILTGQEVVA